MTQEKDILLKVRDLTIGHKDKTLYSGVTFDIRKGECVMLCGANGSGKSTLLKQLTVMDKETVMIPTRIPKIKGFTLREFVRISCFSQSDLGGRLPEKQEAEIDRAMDDLGLSHLASQDISTLSDGEFQKGSIASALVRNASVILLDEPTAFLDAENRISVLRTLRHLCSDGERTPAVIFSTHDLHDALTVCSKVIALGADGKVRVSVTDMEKTIRTIFKTDLYDNQI